MMGDVEWDVLQGLRDGDDVLPECVRYARLVHDVWILPGEVYDYNMRAEYQIEDVLNDRTLLPDVVYA